MSSYREFPWIHNFVFYVCVYVLYNGFYVSDFIALSWATLSAFYALLFSHVTTNKDDDDDDSMGNPWESHGNGKYCCSSVGMRKSMGIA